MTVKKTESIWDDLLSMVLKFLKDHWWKIAALVFILGLGISSIDIRCGKASLKKGEVDLKQLKG